jgi:hypothetical protein
LFVGSVGNYGYDCLKEAKCPEIKTINSLIDYIVNNVFEKIPFGTAVSIILGMVCLYFFIKITFWYIPEIVELRQNIDRVGLLETLVPVDPEKLITDRKKLWDLYFSKTSSPTEFINILGINGEMTFSKQALDLVGQKAEAAPLRDTLEKVDNEIKIKVLFLSPDSEYFKLRVFELFPAKEDELANDHKKRLRSEEIKFRAQTKSAVKFLKEMQKKKKKIEWRFYSRPPVWKLIITNNFVWQQIYPKGIHVEYSQTNIFSANSKDSKQIGLYSGFHTIFDLLWDQFESTSNRNVPPISK